MKNLKLYLLLILLFGLLSCQEKSKSYSTNLPKQEEITIIKWSNYGGALGFAETVTITKDSIIHSDFVAANNNSMTINKYKNTKEEWEKLINSFRLNDFRKIKSGGSAQPADGTDQKIYIETNKTSDSIINGYEDKLNYSKIVNFVKLLDSVVINNRNRNN